MELLIFYGTLYSISIVIFLFFSAVANGFNGTEISKKDIIYSIFWPLLLGLLIGGIIRVITERLRKEK